MLELRRQENATLLEELRLALQGDINKQKAAHADVLEYGWRPFICWVYATAFASDYILTPSLIFALAAAEHKVNL